MIENREPIDKLAAIVTSKAPSDAVFTPWNKNHPQNKWNDFLKKASDANQLDNPPPSWIPDKRGQKYARLTVLGFADRHRSGKDWKNFWVVRCDCGKLEVWSSSALNTNSESATMCRDCKYVERLKFRTSQPPNP